MARYKVIFDGYRITSAKRIGMGCYCDFTEFEISANKRFLKWYIVEANNAREAIEITMQIAWLLWGEIVNAN